MTTNTTVNGWPLPDLSDIPNITTAENTPLAMVDRRVNPIFATTAARDAAITAPDEGMECYVTASGIKYIYNGTVWVGAPWHVRQQPVGVNRITQDIPPGLQAMSIKWRARSAHSGTAGNYLFTLLYTINNDTTGTDTVSGKYHAATLNGNGYFSTTTWTASAYRTTGILGGGPGAEGGAGRFGYGSAEFIGLDIPDSVELGGRFSGWAHEINEVMVTFDGGGSYQAAGPYTSIEIFTSDGNFVQGTDFQFAGR